MSLNLTKSVVNTASQNFTANSRNTVQHGKAAIANAAEGWHWRNDALLIAAIGNLTAFHIYKNLMFWFAPSLDGKSKLGYSFQGIPYLAKRICDLSKETGLTRDQVRYGIKILKRLGIIECICKIAFYKKQLCLRPLMMPSQVIEAYGNPSRNKLPIPTVPQKIPEINRVDTGKYPTMHMGKSPLSYGKIPRIRPVMERADIQHAATETIPPYPLEKGELGASHTKDETRKEEEQVERMRELLQKLLDQTETLRAERKVSNEEVQNKLRAIRLAMVDEAEGITLRETKSTRLKETTSRAPESATANEELAPRAGRNIPQEKSPLRSPAQATTTLFTPSLPPLVQREIAATASLPPPPPPRREEKTATLWPTPPSADGNISKRALGTNPRALGTNPRAIGKSWQQREDQRLADLRTKKGNEWRKVFEGIPYTPYPDRFTNAYLDTVQYGTKGVLKYQK